MEKRNTKTGEDVESVDVYTANGLLTVGHRYLDVRTNEEFAKSHFKDALNIPYMFKTDEGRIINPDFLPQLASVCKKDDHLIVGFSLSLLYVLMKFLFSELAQFYISTCRVSLQACNSGGRASRACVELLNAGYEHVANMEGGYSAWVDAGFAGDKSAGELKTACKFRPKDN
ncbi:unnamed protein product [Eruca vesicaria subsp. sativa]|uniref:Rhodanese domain-containing protein n=1 Tax=Eruca vesicaria subsp. sativa TaxID=29727 RepID=A0ABC8K0Y0_ERUVS|nr:unnamed protein product [Eruca vesicaria subsp. sativa]